MSGEYKGGHLFPPTRLGLNVTTPLSQVHTANRPAGTKKPRQPDAWLDQEEGEEGSSPLELIKTAPASSTGASLQAQSRPMIVDSLHDPAASRQARQNKGSVSNLPASLSKTGTGSRQRPPKSGFAGFNTSRVPSHSSRFSDRPESLVLGNLARVQTSTGELPSGRNDPSYDGRDSFGADRYFANKPLPRLPVDRELQSLQRPDASLSRYALQGPGGRLRTSYNPSATPSPGDTSPRLPDPALPNEPPSRNW